MNGEMEEFELDPFEKMLKDEQRAQEALSSRYKALQSSLERRTNMPFDPRLMRVATALLSPTKSGTTGESIGMAAEALVDESEKEALRQRETLKMQAELEERMLEMQRQGLGLQALRRLRPGEKPTDATKPTAPAGIPSGGIGIQIAPPDPSYMADEDYAVTLYSAGKKPGEIMEALEKRRRENIDVREGGVFDRASGTFYATPKGGVVEKFPVRNPETGEFENYSVPVEIAGRLSQLQLSNPEAYDAAVRQLVLGERPTAVQPGQPQQPPGELNLLPEPPSQLGAPNPEATVPGVSPTAMAEAAPTPRRLTASEQELRQERRKGRVQAQAKAEEEDILEMTRGARGADETILTSESLIKLASDPNADDMFGVLSKPGVMPAIGRLIETGVGVPGFSVGIPELQNALTVAGLSPEDVAKYQTALQQMVTFQLKMSQYVKGAVSNYEQGLFQKASINPNDRPQTIKMKANMAIALADFARRKELVFNQLDMSIPEFRNSREYNALLRETADRLNAIMEGKSLRRSGGRGVSTQDIDAELKRRGLQ